MMTSLMCHFSQISIVSEISLEIFEQLHGGHPPCIMCIQYIEGCSVHRGVFSTSGEIMSTSGGYLEYIGRCSVYQRDITIHVGEQLNKILSISIENLDVLNIPRCIHDIPPMYSWYPPTCIMVSPRCTHDIPPMYSWYPSDVLIVSLRCTHSIPPMYS